MKASETKNLLSTVQKTLDNIHKYSREHQEILTRLEEQVRKTNGRVTELEKSDMLNKIVRYVLSFAAIGLFSSVGLKILSLLNFTN